MTVYLKFASQSEAIAKLTAALSASGQEPATHYIASGWVPEELVQTLTMCATSESPPDEAMTDKGLKPCVPSAT